jgi:hypothetical protein
LGKINNSLLLCIKTAASLFKAAAEICFPAFPVQIPVVLFCSGERGDKVA